MSDRFKYSLLVLYLSSFIFPLKCSNGIAKSNPGNNLPKTQLDNTNALKITYVANEGVFLEWRNNKILIDALHRRGNSYYMRISSRTLDALEAAQSPFDGVNLILATHVHPDHFDAHAVGRHLLSSPTTVFFAAQQSVDATRDRFDTFTKLEKQVKSVTPAWNEFIELSFENLNVKVLGLRHGGARFAGIQNLGFILKLGEHKLLHIGDAEASVENFKPFHLPDEKIDIAFIPYWYLMDSESRQVVDQHISPRHIIAVHIPPVEAAKIAKDIQEWYPRADAFTAAMEVRSFKL